MIWRRLALVGYAVLVGVTLGNSSCARKSDATAQPQGGAARIITIGGAITETVFALGAGDRVVAIDTSSFYPDAAQRLPKVGYQRSLTAETVLSFRPDLVIAAAEAGPAATIEQLRSAGVRVELTREAHDARSAANRILAVGKLLGKEAEAAKLAEPVTQVMAPPQAPQPPKVLFLYARGGGVAMVAGHPSPISEMISLAGGVNAVSGFTGYKQLSGEAVIEAAPDVIVLPSRGLEALGGPERLWALPGMASTPAGEAKRVVAMDDLLLLGYGPRLPEAVKTLRAALAQ